MISSTEDVMNKLQKNPEMLEDEELAKTSLSVFSKCLGSFTSRRIINTYLRWLEVQRTAPRRNINFNWINTIAHWTQSLRARGFSLEEIHREVIVWKEENGPFVEPNPSDPESRLPPMFSNLTFGWDRTPMNTKNMASNEYNRVSASDDTSMKYDIQIERKLDSPLTKVPTNYICNRCKGRGHYVGECPTNEDPAYDIAAGTDYVCKYCKERATHYFLFCPRNPDPNSIYRRRQEKAMRSISQTGMHSNMALRKSTGSLQDSPRSSPSTTSSRSSLATLKASSARADFELFTDGKRANSREETSGRLKYEKDDEYIQLNAENAEMIRSPRIAGTMNQISVSGPLETLGPTDTDLFWESMNDEIQRNQSRSAQKSSEFMIEQTAADELTCVPVKPVVADQSPHAEFLSWLFARHPSQVNPMYRRRMTTLDMWEVNDEKRRKLEDDEKLGLCEGDLSIDPLSPDSKARGEIDERGNYEIDESVNTSDARIVRPSKQAVQQVGFIIDTIRFRNHKKSKSMEEESPIQQERMHAIQKKIDSIENLRTRLELGDDVGAAEMEHVVSGDLL